MGIRIIGAVSAIVISAAVSAPAFAQAASPATFVTRIYQALDSDDNDNPVLRNERIYSAGLLALMRADERAAAARGDGVGTLDFDPLCNCQDIAATFTVKIVEENRTRATARVYSDAMDGSGRLTITLRLVKETAGWRIDEISAPPSFASLRGLLRNGGRDALADADGDTDRVAAPRIGQRDAYGRVIGVPFRDGAVARNILRNGPGAGYWPRRMVLLPADQVEADYDDSVVLVPAE